MRGINKINVTENRYLNLNNKLSFKSKFIPNDALEGAFRCAKSDVNYTKAFTGVIEHLLNDGKDNLIEVTKNKSGGSALKINGKKVNYYDRNVYDDMNPIDNIIDYYLWQNHLGTDVSNLSYKEFKAIQPAINKLNADLNADDVANNPEILHNIENNVSELYKVLHKYLCNKLDKLEEKIFNCK